MAEDAFRITGLSPSHAYLMLILFEEPGLSQGELSDKINVKASTMTRFIDKLITNKYVERIQEGRVTYIHPTEEGRKLQPMINEALNNLYQKYCEVLGEEFAVKLTADIHKANEIIKKKD